MTYSQDFTNAVWVKNQTSVTSNAIAAPGAGLASKIVESTAPAIAHNLRNMTTTTAGVQHTVSGYFKAGERRHFTFLVLETVTGATASWHVDLSTGAFVAGSTGIPSTARITSAGNGWWRVSVTLTPPNPLSYFDFRLSNVMPSTSFGTAYDGDGVSGLYVWGVQLEANYYASSYIPTTTAPVTRAADNMSLASGRFAAIYGATATTGFLICDVMLPQQAGAASQAIAFLRNGGANITMFNSLNSTNLRAQVFDGATSTNYNIQGGTFVPGTPFRFGLRFIPTGIALSVNGGALATGTGPTPVLTELWLGALNTGAIPLNGRLRAVYAGAVAPSDAKFQAACALGANVEAVVA